MEARWQRLAVFGLLAALAALPMAGLLTQPDSFVAAPFTELPIRLWVSERFLRIGVLGGPVPELGFPEVGALNNVDPLGCLVLGVLRPLLGRPGAFNLYVFGVTLVNLACTFLLARRLVGGLAGPLCAAIAFALSPLVLLYGMASGLTDILHLWPYPLAIWVGLRALERPGWRLGVLLGLLGGIAALSCPYHGVVFAGAALGGLPFAGWRLWRWWRVAHPPARAHGHTLLAALLVGGLLLGVSVLELKSVMADSQSMVSASYVDSTRHHAPYPVLMPMGRDQVMAYLEDYVTTGKESRLERHMASRYLRASTPGFVVLGLAVLGMVVSRRREGLILAGVAIFGIMASTGPYLAVAPRLGLRWPVNVFWLLPHFCLPGGDRLLEPFRYGFPVMLALALAAAWGVSWLTLRRRVGRWLGLAAPVLMIAELVVLSPVPMPLPTTRLTVDLAYFRLDDVLPPGAIIDLPFYWQATRLFDRRHFLHQLIHRRPIPDMVTGYPPPFLIENQFTAALLHAEKPFGDLVVQVEHPEKVDGDARRLVADGFVGVVLDPGAVQTPLMLAEIKGLLVRFGQPVELGSRLVYRLHPEVKP